MNYIIGILKNIITPVIRNRVFRLGKYNRCRAHLPISKQLNPVTKTDICLIIYCILMHKYKHIIK